MQKPFLKWGELRWSRQLHQPSLSIVCQFFFYVKNGFKLLIKSSRIFYGNFQLIRWDILHLELGFLFVCQKNKADWAFVKPLRLTKLLWQNKLGLLSHSPTKYVFSYCTLNIFGIPPFWGVIWLLVVLGYGRAFCVLGISSKKVYIFYQRMVKKLAFRVILGCHNIHSNDPLGGTRILVDKW